MGKLAEMYCEFLEYFEDKLREGFYKFEPEPRRSIELLLPWFGPEDTHLIVHVFGSYITPSSVILEVRGKKSEHVFGGSYAFIHPDFSARVRVLRCVYHLTADEFGEEYWEEYCREVKLPTDRGLAERALHIVRVWDEYLPDEIVSVKEESPLKFYYYHKEMKFDSGYWVLINARPVLPPRGARPIFGVTEISDYVSVYIPRDHPYAYISICVCDEEDCYPSDVKVEKRDLVRVLLEEYFPEDILFRGVERTFSLHNLILKKIPPLLKS